MSHSVSQGEVRVHSGLCIVVVNAVLWGDCMPCTTGAQRKWVGNLNRLETCPVGLLKELLVPGESAGLDGQG